MMGIMGTRIRLQMLSFGFRPAVIAAAPLLLLAGCIGGGEGWTKPSLDVSQRSADFAECKQDTRQATQREYAIEQDINASRGTDMRNRGTFDQLSQNIDTSAKDQSTALLDSCMLGKGYEQVK